MKRREFTRLAAFAAALAATTAFLPGADAIAQDKKFTIGFSQATTIEPWRAQFNKDIIAEAAKHPEVELIVTDGED
jgi:ribose transport system substrate-binding protein